MISRIWHGWTTPANTAIYEALLTQEIFTGIEKRAMHGFKSIRLLRRGFGDEMEFVTSMVFDSMQAVREFAGEDYEAAVDPASAWRLLAHFDQRSQH